MQEQIKKDLLIERDLKRELRQIEEIIKGNEKDNVKYDSIKAILMELSSEISEAKLTGMIEQLTGFWGPKVAEEYLAKEMERAKRIKKPLTIAFLDIDFLKYINDTFGHVIGTKGIKELAEIIKNTIRKSDVVSRYGGDEFLIIFPESKISQADVVLSRIKDKVSNLIVDEVAKISLSKGVAEYNGEDLDVEKLLDIADKDLYEAKKTRVNLNLNNI